MVPPAVLDYIIIHELMHLIEPITQKFWRLVAGFAGLSDPPGLAQKMVPLKI